MKKSLIKFIVDEDLKLQAGLICFKLGIDLNTYLRMCLSRLVSSNGIPFSMEYEKEENKGIKAMKRAQRIAEEKGLSNLSLDEINKIILDTRK